MINKPDLIEKIILDLAEKGNDKVLLVDMQECFNHLVHFLTLSLKKRERIEIRGFGVFESKFRTKRKAINPKSKDVINLDNRYNPSFKPSKFLNKEITVKLKSPPNNH